MDLVPVNSTLQPLMSPGLWTSGARLASASSPVPSRANFGDVRSDDSELERIRGDHIEEWRQYVVALFEARLADGAPIPTAIDEALEDDGYAKFFARACELPAARPQYLSPTKRFPSCLKLDSVWLELRRGTSVSNAIVKAGEQVREAGTGMIATGISAERRSRQPVLWFMDDATMPCAVMDSLLGIRRAEAALLVIDALTRPIIREMSTLKDVIEVWNRSLVVYLRWLASLPEAFVPKKLMPPAARIDLPRAYAEQGQIVSALRSVNAG